MKSKAHIKSHPIHPLLIAFPIAFFTGTYIFDILFVIAGNENFAETGRYLNIAAIISALVAAVPGTMDFFFTIPPDSSAKKRGAKHGIINISVVIIFTIALLLRPNDNSLLIIGLETIGMILLTIAGWMGGTLVYRNQIGVDIRYAGAGKHNEEYISADGKKVKVAATNELELNQMKLVHVNGKRIVIGKTEDGYVAFDDHCTHRGGTLAGGAMICGTVQCPWHGSQFDVRTGEVKAGPAKEKIKTYRINTEGNDVFVEL